jgi:transposase-like protein
MDSHKRSAHVERLEVVETGRRRRWSEDEKLKIVVESLRAPRLRAATRSGSSPTLRSRGLWMENGPRRFIRPAPRAAAESWPDRDDAKRSKAALAIWQSAMSAGGSLVETYLVSRDLHLRPPPTLRCHAGLKHPSGGIWPAMVALVTRGSDHTPLAIHRTFLARDGGGKAPVDPQAPWAFATGRPPPVTLAECLC